MDISLADNLCSVWEIQEPSEEYCVSPSSISVPHFCFVVKVDLTYVWMELDEEDGEEDQDFGYSFVTRNDQFKVPRHLLIQEESWGVTISHMLTSMKVPSHAQASMAEKIRDFAVTVAGEKRNLDRKVVYLAVDIQAMTTEEEEEVLEDVSMYMAGSDMRPVPVLEKVRVEEGNNFEDKQCVVCMEGFLEGTELTRLPCYHVYHHNCILDWLMECSSCPLCRFDIEMLF